MTKNSFEIHRNYISRHIELYIDIYRNYLRPFDLSLLGNFDTLPDLF